MTTRELTQAALDRILALQRAGKRGELALAMLEQEALRVLQRPACEANVRHAAHALLGAIVATEIRACAHESVTTADGLAHIVGTAA